jgi:hypothetical protein
MLEPASLDVLGLKDYLRHAHAKYKQDEYADAALLYTKVRCFGDYDAPNIVY